MIRIEKIKQSIEDSLPGKKYQYKMAPSDRIIRDHSINLKTIRKSAVLILLFYKEEKLHVLLTQRANYNGPHSGQISFPGGKFEHKKDQDLIDTAIRETFEEINLSHRYFKILGPLTSLNIPISQISVQPYLAFCSNIETANSENYEVTDIYEIPINHLQNPRNTKIKSKNNIEFPYFDFEGKVIWGATAMILSELLEIISHSEQN